MKHMDGGRDTYLNDLCIGPITVDGGVVGPSGLVVGGPSVDSGSMRAESMVG